MKKMKTMNLKMTINSQLSTNEPEKTKTKQSSQDGGVGRYTLPPCTTERTTNLKTKHHQNCGRIELYGSLTTKEL